MSQPAILSTSRMATDFRDELGDTERWAIRFKTTLTLTGLGLLILSQIGKSFSGSANTDLYLGLQSIAALLVALPLFVRAVRGLFAFDSDAYTDQLVGLAVLGAVVSGEFITAVLIPIVIEVGHYFEELGIQGSRAAIEGLQRLSATTATILDGGNERCVAGHQVQVGDTLVAHPGDILAADGRVMHGVSAVDESLVTGESLPRDVGIDHEVLAGTINLNGLLHVQVTAIGQQTSAGRIAKLFAAAVASKPLALRTLERSASLYIPTVLLLAAVVFFVTRDLERVIALLVVSCPCALVLSAPAAMIAALAVATRKGVLIKNTRFLESLAEARTVVFDKTGTITESKLKIVAIIAGPGESEESVWRIAGVCALGSKHPVARAISDQASQSNRLTQSNALSHRELPGRGMTCQWEDQTLHLGRPSWLIEQAISVPEIPAHAGPVVAVAQGGKFVGFMFLSDSVRPEASEAIKQLRRLKVNRLVLLTGDRREAADIVGRSLGFDEVHSEQLPDDKYRFVCEERRKGVGVIVVGDGVNDALALAAGNVGVAMGARGSDIAINSADVALTTNDLLRLPMAIRLARRTRVLMAQNFALAIASAILMLALATAGVITPLTGAVIHNLGSVLVLLNSGRMLRWECGPEKSS